MPVINAAARYVRLGWAVIPVPYRKKNPGFREWQRLRLQESELASRFCRDRQNIGVLLGEPSNWLVDVDLDHAKAVETAPRFLPETGAIFGRTGKPRSHWLYRVSAPVETKRFRSKSDGVVAELRATGMQTIFPPSTHPSGEVIQWETPGIEPASVNPEQLLGAVERLVADVRGTLGEAAPKTNGSTRTPPSRTEIAERCLNAMLRRKMIDHHDGSNRLYMAACRVVEHDLSDDEGVAVIRKYEVHGAFPRRWSDEEIVQRIRDAEKDAARGAALAAGRSGTGELRAGSRDPATGKVVLSTRKTLPTAEAFLREFYAHVDGTTLHNYGGTLLTWEQNRYVEVEEEAVKRQLQVWLHGALRLGYSPSTGETKLEQFDSNPSTVNAALETIRTYSHLSVKRIAPCWLGKPKGTCPEAEEILACRSTLLHLPTMTALEPTPQFFNTTALEFDYDPNAAQPKAWLHFLHQLFDDDVPSHDLLREWFGYCLTGDTSQQKMLLIVGPRRSGKGTIARVLGKLLGEGNVCGPTIADLAGPFGLQPLLGKSLATVSDARFSGEKMATVVERLLCISGEDAITVDRKHLASVTTKFRTRFLFLSNELPRLRDSSSALAGRFLVLRLTESFFGKEDTGLSGKLLAELPGILKWAMEGWKRLHERGRFVQPESVRDVVDQLEELGSPVAAFVRERCVVGPRCRVSVDELFTAWRSWCETDGRKFTGTKQTFGRDLQAAVPAVRLRRNGARFYEGIALKARPETSATTAY